MKILGFNLNKINAEKLKETREGIKINTSIDILDIKEAKSELLNTPEKILGVNFNVFIIYEPEIAKITFSGGLLLTLEKKPFDEVIKKWKEKQLPEDFRMDLFNFILTKSNIKALQLEEELNLPYHIPLQVLKNPAKEKKE